MLFNRCHPFSCTTVPPIVFSPPYTFLHLLYEQQHPFIHRRQMHIFRRRCLLQNDALYCVFIYYRPIEYNVCCYPTCIIGIITTSSCLIAAIVFSSTTVTIIRLLTSSHMLFFSSTPCCGLFSSSMNSNNSTSFSTYHITPFTHYSVNFTSGHYAYFSTSINFICNIGPTTTCFIVVTIFSSTTSTRCILTSLM